LAPAFALGAADADETAAFHAALARTATSARTAQALAPYRELAEQMLFAVPPAAVPPALAGRLQAALAAEDAPTSGAQARLATPLPGGTAVGTSSEAAGQAGTGGRAWHWPRLVTLAALLAAAALLLLNLFWMRELSSLRASDMALQQKLHDQATEFAAALAAQEQTLQGQKEQIAAQDALLAQFVTGESERYTMNAVVEGSGAIAQVAWLDTANTAVLRAEGFPPLEEGEAYQLWLIRGDQRTSGGLFTVDEYGCGTLIFHPTESLEDFDGMGITPEPATGSPGPTAPPVVRAQL
jgi:hypothetical protein